MENIWAPWRSEYISAKKDGDCFLCSAPITEDAGGLKRELVLFKGALTTVILNKFPYNPGHILVSPLRHAARLEHLTPEESIDMFRMIRHAVMSLTRAYNPEGFNVGMNLGRAAGAGIEEHLHMHVVPRWNGDSNFMPILAEVKIVPEHLDASYDKLKPFFDRV